ncbi:MAG: HEAT repeat domain-containing protein [Phycisphaerales bacterium]|nr:HEAT repeat domain-containing protein [Phycisphaerales bacterium]
MPAKQTIFRLLLKDTDPSADEALALAIPGADITTMRAIMETLLLRKTPQGLFSTVAHFHLLDEPCKQLVLEQIDILYSALRQAMGTNDEQARINTLEIIHRGHAYRAAYLFDQALHDRSARVRQVATEAIYGMVDELYKAGELIATRNLEPNPDPETLCSRMQELADLAEDRLQVVSALQSGLACFNMHLQPRIVEASMWFIDAIGPRFWAMLTVPGSRAGHAAITIFNGLKSPRLVPFAMGGLKHNEFRASIVKALTHCVEPEFWSEWLRQGWRIAQPKTSRSMAAIKELHAMSKGGDLFFQLPAVQQPMLASWLKAVGMPETTKLGALRELQRRGTPTARRAAVWALVRMQEPMANTLLHSIAHDEDPELARMARLELARRNPSAFPLADVTTPTTGSWTPHESAWDAGLDSMTFEEYWSLFDMLKPEQRIRQGTRLLSDRTAIRTVLNRRLIESDTVSQIRALRIIVLLHLAGEFPEHLYRLSQNAHAEVRAAAVTALGGVVTETSRHLLRTAMHDEDQRVQANAVEALAEVGAENVIEELKPKLHSPDNRVRINAVRALLKLGVREAAETLLGMLEEDNRAQRISALWLIEQMGLSSVANRIMKMVEADQDEEVSRRADRLLHKLSEQIPTRPAVRATLKEVPT